MNYWKQFAEMLGLELGQEFSLVKPNGEKENEDTYKITEDGIYYQSVSHSAWWTESAETLSCLLKGSYKAVPKPWKPKKCEKYFIYEPGVVDDAYSFWADDDIDLCRWKCGNCFKTKEEAETKGKEIMEELLKEYKEA